jgi:putative acetyltransferase
MAVTIRPEATADAPAIEAVTVAAFRDAPHTSHTEQHIVAALRRAGQLSVSLVAEDEGGGEVVGHVAVSPVVLSDGSPHWFGLGPISVAPGRQSQGIGSRLMHAALEALQARDAAGCVLLGDPVWYGRFGFRAGSGLVLPSVPAEYFQALAWRGPVPVATVAYHPAFDATAAH